MPPKRQVTAYKVNPTKPVQRPQVGAVHYPAPPQQNNVVNAPQFPGWQKGNSPEEVQDFIRDQIRRKGFLLTGGTTAKDFKLEISGSARFFYGLTFLNDIGFCSLTINNEVVFEMVSTGFLQFGTTNQDYFAVNRPLSGQDQISITVTGIAGYQNEPLQVVYK